MLAPRIRVQSNLGITLYDSGVNMVEVLQQEIHTAEKTIQHEEICRREKHSIPNERNERLIISNFMIMVVEVVRFGSQSIQLQIHFNSARSIIRHSAWNEQCIS